MVGKVFVKEVGSASVALWIQFSCNQLANSYGENQIRLLECDLICIAV